MGPVGYFGYCREDHEWGKELEMLLRYARARVRVEQKREAQI
jgi:hypothetical protein